MLKHQLTVSAEELDTIYDKIWNNPLVGIYVAQGGVFQAISPKVEDVTGFSPNELIDRRSDAMIYPEDLEVARCAARDMLGGKRVFPYEFRIVTKQEAICWVMVSVSPIVFRGKPAILGCFMDITDPKIVEDRLQESEKLYRAIFETTGTATVIIEDDMTLSLLNSEFENMTGYRKAEWEGKKKWIEYIPQKDRIRMKKTHKQRRIDPENSPRNFEHELVDARGRVRNMYLTADLIPGTRKSVVSFMDITAWKTAERRLKKREQELQTKSRKLEELITALRVLLKQREDDRHELEEKVLANVKEFVMPHIEEIQSFKLDERVRAYVEILRSNLEDIISPFSRRLSSKYLNLTPKEIQVANFIKEGKTSKEIANIMNVSKSAVDLHRYRLRCKLGLNNEKANLRSHLSQYL